MFNLKKSSLVILGATALVCSRALFVFFNDPEGPNLLIVTVAAVVVYVLSLVATIPFPSFTGYKKVVVAVVIQILIVTGLYFCLR
jgi:hypothetical protein